MVAETSASASANAEAERYDEMARSIKLPGDPALRMAIRERDWWLNNAACLEAEGR